MIKELNYKELKHFCDPQELNFKTTDELEAFLGLVGQERAIKALEFGLSVRKKGYNIYISGVSGTGKTTFAQKYANERAKSEEIPEDLCYVYNFENPKEPMLLTFPAGKAVEFKKEMEELIDRLFEELPRAFSEKGFELKKTDILKEFYDFREQIIKKMTEEVKEQNFGVKTTNTGIYFMPIVNGEIISEEQFDELNQEEKDIISINSEIIQKQTAEIMNVIKEFEKKTCKRVEDLEYSAGLFTVGNFLAPLATKYESDDKVLNYLQDIKEDILGNIEEFMEGEAEEEPVKALLPWYSKKDKEEILAKYKVNIIKDNTGLTGAPVITDFCPTYTDLIGEIEYDSEYGSLTTDFMKIKPGLLHKANGGYLILQAYDVFSNPMVWDILRRSLISGEIVIEYSREHSSGIVLSTLKPGPIKLNLKVILVGDGFYYDILYNFDNEFRKQFKILVEFDYEMKANKNNTLEMAGYVKRFVKDHQIKDFDCEAVSKIIEYSSRVAENQKKFTTKFNKISEILIESDAWADISDSEIVTKIHVEKAIIEREYRLNMYEEKLSKMIEDNIIMIDVSGNKVGQINGLAVIDTGEYAFAKPSRITATTYVGKAGIVNIEKEADMSGSIHNKGIQVLIGYLGQTYAQDFPLSLSCRVCFEQNYSGIDGDSASSAELYAVLSSLSEFSINQEIAVTGSINQYGEIQPIGGVTYKVEGFFDLCQKRGLTGNQGVIIPVQNIADLVLKDSVIEAVKNGIFHIYAINHVDDGIQILTGREAGRKNEKDKYPSNSIHGKVMKKLKSFYKKSLSEIV